MFPEKLEEEKDSFSVFYLILPATGAVNDDFQPLVFTSRYTVLVRISSPFLIFVL